MALIIRNQMEGPLFLLRLLFCLYLRSNFDAGSHFFISDFGMGIVFKEGFSRLR
jgi:hypothetical protein